MKPGDHPEFFRLPAPEGRSRESTLRLDREGRFWHDGARVEHPGMQRAFASWIDLHPDDGRFILTNGWDWTYLTVEDVPFFVKAVGIDGASVSVTLSDGSVEPMDARSLRVGERDAVYLRVKGGRFEARFMPEAQTALAPLLIEGAGGELELEVAGVRHRVGGR